MKRIALVVGLFFLGAQPAFAGKPMLERKIAHNRILVGDIVENAPASIRVDRSRTCASPRELARREA